MMCLSQDHWPMAFLLALGCHVAGSEAKKQALAQTGVGRASAEDARGQH